MLGRATSEELAKVHKANFARGGVQEYFLVALSRPQEHPAELDPESAGPSMFSPKSVTNKVRQRPQSARSQHSL